MNNRWKSYWVLIVLCLLSKGVVAQKPDSGWKSLFNGKDLSGWETYLGPANLSGYDSKQDTEPPIGLNKDPLQVFKVEDGAVHVSGQVWGGIISKASYGNFHIRFQTKWGPKKWPPKHNSVRDAGFLFHGSEPYDHGFKAWMRSVEMQIQEGEFGDYFEVGAGTPEFQLTAAKTVGGADIQQHDGSAPLKRHSGRVYRSADFESPFGEWTTSEVVARQADAVFIVNGFVVNRFYNLYSKDLQRQVTSGKLEFQSEGAEVFYRKIEIRPVSFIQRNPIVVSNQKEFILKAGEGQTIEITNRGEDVELIAAELIGKKPESFRVELPSLPFTLKKGAKMRLPVHLKPGDYPDAEVKLRLETVLGPVSNFEVLLKAKE